MISGGKTDNIDNISIKLGATSSIPYDPTGKADARSISRRSTSLDSIRRTTLDTMKISPSERSNNESKDLSEKATGIINFDLIDVRYTY